MNFRILMLISLCLIMAITAGCGGGGGGSQSWITNLTVTPPATYEGGQAVIRANVSTSKTVTGVHAVVAGPGGEQVSIAQMTSTDGKIYQGSASIPANTTAQPITYKVTVTASASGGESKSSSADMILPAPGPPQAMSITVTGPSNFHGGNTTIEAQIAANAPLQRVTAVITKPDGSAGPSIDLEAARSALCTYSGVYNAPENPGLADAGYTVVVTATDATGQSCTFDPASFIVPFAPWKDVYVGRTLAAGFDMGVNTDNNETSWVSDRDGYMECNYPAGQAWGAVFITVGAPTADQSLRQVLDASQYNTLSLEIKGGHGGESVSIGVKTATDPDWGSEPKYTVTGLTGDWQKVEVPFTQFIANGYPASRLSVLYVVCEFVFDGPASETVSFRNVRFETH